MVHIENICRIISQMKNPIHHSFKWLKRLINFFCFLCFFQEEEWENLAIEEKTWLDTKRQMYQNFFGYTFQMLMSKENTQLDLCFSSSVGRFWIDSFLFLLLFGWWKSSNLSCLVIHSTTCRGTNDYQTTFERFVVVDNQSRNIKKKCKHTWRKFKQQISNSRSHKSTTLTTKVKTKNDDDFEIFKCSEWCWLFFNQNTDHHNRYVIIIICFSCKKKPILSIHLAKKNIVISNFNLLTTKRWLAYSWFAVYLRHSRHIN